VFLAMLTMAWRPQHAQLQFACAHRFLASPQFLHKLAGSRRGRRCQPCARRVWRPAHAATMRMRPQITCLTAVAAQSRREQAWAVLSAMREAGVAPSTRSYNALLAACDRGGQPARALEVLRRMQREVHGATLVPPVSDWLVANASPV